MSASETERRYIWGCSRDEGPLDYDQTISALIGVPPPPPLPLSQSTSLSRWHFGKSHCHTTFNKDKSLRRAAGDDWPDRARSLCAEYPSHNLFHSRLACFPLGEASNAGAKHRQDTQTSVRIYAHRWHERTSTHRHITHCTEVCQFLSFSPPSLDTVFMHIQHLP